MALAKSNAYIISLEAKDIVHFMRTNGKYSIDKKSLKKLYGGSLPYSLDLIQLNQFAPKEFKMKDGKQYTKALLDVKFNYAYYQSIDEPRSTFKTGKVITYSHRKGKPIASKLELRKELYEDGFIIDDEKYVLYKRSSSKARVGSCLFIKEKYYDKMIKWSRMNLDFQLGETVDELASLKAYESLTLSGIEDTVTIKPQEILLIADIKGEFVHWASVTELVERIPVTREKEIKNDNIIFDGQALADTSLFQTDEEAHQKGMMLLRNRFFKSCAFNTNIQKYFENNGISYVNDMFGRKKDATKIKLIITPSSLKLFKFVYKTKEKTKGEVKEENYNRVCYDYWLKNLSHKFGICKHEKASPFGNYNQLSYQMINSMPFTYEDIEELLQEEIRYVNLLKNDVTVFKQYISNYNVSNSRDFIFNALAVNAEVQYTQLYKNFRGDKVEDYIKNLQNGKIKVPDTDYAVLCGNPYEMLRYAAGKPMESTLHKGKQVYCSKFEDGQKVVGFRNPHICAGNVLVAENVYKEEFAKYFNLTENIVIINSYDNDFYDRLQGADLDSDTVLLSSNPLLLKRALECVDYLTPVNRIVIDKTPRRYNTDDMARIDNVISENDIGYIVNWSQILNSYYWNEYNNGKPPELLEFLYNKISMLSSFSQLEIDKAKKYFDSSFLNITQILQNFKKVKYEGTKIIRTDTIEVLKTEITSDKDQLENLIEQRKMLTTKVHEGQLSEKQKLSEIKAAIDLITKEEKEKIVRPMFLKYCGKGKDYKFELFDTPMDFVIRVLKDKIKPAERSKTIPLTQIINIEDKYDSNRKQIPIIKKIVSDTDKNIKSLRAQNNRDKNEDDNLINLFKEYAIDELKKRKFTTSTALSIYKRLYGGKKSRDKEIDKYRQLLLGLLYKAHPDEMIACFNHMASGFIPVIIEDENGTIELWGKKYKKTLI
jgi:hypothetical protein